MGRIGLLLLETIILALIIVLGLIYVLERGPSETARNLFVKSVNESSAMGFTSRIFLPDETVDEIMAASLDTPEVSTMDMSLVSVNSVDSSDDTFFTDAWGYTDEDGDGIVLVPVKGSTYSGYMMIVYDPGRVILGTYPDEYGQQGHTVEEFVEGFGAIAGLNASGFRDTNGQGNGSDPHGIVVSGGEIVCDIRDKYAFVGIDDKCILHVDCQSVEAVEDAGIMWGAGYGPVLVSNGEILINDNLSGLNPRSAIGQRSDGAILLLVIDGRHVVSLGASYLDEAEIMVRFGAVNACNLDGGSSSLMYYNGEYVNNKAAVIGIRDIPTAWLVMPQGED